MRASTLVLMSSIVFLAPFTALCGLSVIAFKEYGYEAGDEYRFVIEMFSTADTEDEKNN